MIGVRKRLFESRFIYMVLTLLGSLYVHGQTPATAPAALHRAGAREPFFLSAESARAENGDIRWEAFDSSVRTVLQADAATRKASATSATGSTDSPCDVWTISFDHSPGAFAKFDDVAAAAPAVYRGRVTSVTPGFEFTTPVTLVGIEIEKVVRAESRFPNKGTVYVLYPQADFSIGGLRFCNTGPIRDFAPTMGDQLLLLAFDPPIPTEHERFIVTRPEHLVFLRANRIYSPFGELTSASEPASLERIETRVIAAAAPCH